jgi:hypothetical protein
MASVIANASVLFRCASARWDSTGRRSEWIVGMNYFGNTLTARRSSLLPHHASNQ